MASRADIRFFSVKEANAAVEDLTHLLPAMRRTLSEVEKAESRLSILDLICDRAVSSENPDLREYLSLKVQYHRRIHEFEEMLGHLQTEGYLLRDLDKGVVHFVSRRGTEDVLLCWTEGESEVSHWHEIGEDGLPDEKRRFDIETWGES
jgi:hypothetical protein